MNGIIVLGFALSAIHSVLLTPNLKLHLKPYELHCPFGNQAETAGNIVSAPLHFLKQLPHPSDRSLGTRPHTYRNWLINLWNPLPLVQVDTYNIVRLIKPLCVAIFATLDRW